jgi:prepilin-type N-terminal cleavage/methylation domain-containing protein
MKKQNGFTIIELLIVAAIVGLVGMILIGAANGGLNGGEITFGINGLSETRCVGGYKHTIGPDGSARQIMDEFGKGIRC